jgi:2-dehydro-3-deoxygluconokinase
MDTQMTRHSLDILCLGEPLGEFNATADGLVFGHGGDVSNTAIAAARQGARVGMATALGGDSVGRSFLELWEREGVSGEYVLTDPDAPTGLYMVDHGPEGHRFSYWRAGSAASRMKPGDVPDAAIERTRVLHVSAISQAISTSACDLVFEAIDRARARGTLVSYDTNLRLKLWPLARARAIIQATAAMADLVLPGLDDARLLTGRDDPDEIANAYLDAGAKAVALTLGAAGALVATPEGRIRARAPRVSAVDATGAGDCFDGAFLAEYLKTGDAFVAGRYAAVAAALSTEGFGAVAPIPTRAAVEARVKAKDRT